MTKGIHACIQEGMGGVVGKDVVLVWVVARMRYVGE